jgi:cysteine-rich repeat protein
MADTGLSTKQIGAKHGAAFTLAFISLLGCDSIPLSTAAGGAAGAAGMAGAPGGSGATWAGPRYVLTTLQTNLLRASLASGSAAGAGGTSGSGGNSGSSGNAGAGSIPIACVPSAPTGSPPSSAVCGDGFRAAAEDCDDNNTSNADSCNALCKITPELVDLRVAPLGVLPLPGRTLGSSRHPMAAGCNAVGVSFVDQSTEPPALKLSTYSNAGVPTGTFQFGVASLDSPDPALAALPGDAFAIAWTDFNGDGDELGIQLRRLEPNATTQRSAIVANELTAFSQSAPDVVFDGNQLVVAWVDSTEPATAPDLRYRLFSSDLEPLTGDLTLANTTAGEGDVALAASNGHWAAAWRSGAAGLETIEVQSGTVHWSVGPFLPGLAGDRPDLVFLDATHLALAFTRGTDPDGTGTANVSRLHGAILDTAAPGATPSFALSPAQVPYAGSPAIGQSQPALALFPDHLQVSWRSGALPGDAKVTELWSRRVPFTVAPDRSVTIDPSHVEVPLIRTSAQRVGDQSAFRLLNTNLWPSGGLVAAWTDQGRSFGNVSGAPDVAVQFLPNLPELPSGPRPYPLSADGKYYNVNLLRRNFFPPTVSATFANGFSQLGLNAPPFIFDGGSGWLVWQAPTADDPDATVTLTVDMGQYYSIGAVRPLYDPLGGSARYPVSHRIRLATTPGVWNEVVPLSPVVPADITLSFDATSARYVELTMVGARADSYGGQLTELFVYPSVETSPSPTSADGYDLGFFATTTVNDNFWPVVGHWPPSWPAGPLYAKSLAFGATGDAVGIVDLGAQHDVSRLSLCFFWGAPWLNGGRLEVAAVPDSYTTIYDSGPGQRFGPDASCQEYLFPTQPVRYVRVTDYFVPGVGPSGGTVWSVQAFTNPAPRVAYYPLSADGKYFNVNLTRRPTSDVQPSASVVYGNGATAFSSIPSLTIPGNAIDNDDTQFGWQAPSTLPDATATLTVDLGQVQSIGAIRQYYSLSPSSVTIRAADTLGNWQDLSAPPVTVGDSTFSFAPVSARYVELTMKGTSVGFVTLFELQIFPSSATNPAPSSGSRLGLTYLTGMSASSNTNMGRNGAARIHSVQGASGHYVKTAAEGATGDATLTLDLGQQYQVSQLDLSFLVGQTWPAGGKLDIDDGSGDWVTVFDSGRGTALGPAGDGGTQRITFASRHARYLRLTGYFDPAAAQSGLLENIEVF